MRSRFATISLRDFAIPSLSKFVRERVVVRSGCDVDHTVHIRRRSYVNSIFKRVKCRYRSPDEHHSFELTRERLGNR